MKHLPAAMLDMLRIVLVLAPTALVCSHLAAGDAASGVLPSPTVSPPGPGSKGDTSMCGNVQIPYPFSISKDSAMGSGNFTITCNYTFVPPKPFIFGNVEVISISLEDGQIVVQSLLAFKCYNSSTTFDEWYVFFDFKQAYLISSTSNEFVAIGCDTEAFLGNKDIDHLKYNLGCISYCASVDEASKDGDDCVGVGCCKADIADKLHAMRVYWPDRTTGRDSTYNYSPCSYAFIAKKGWYKFRRQDLYGQGNNSFLNRFKNKSVPLVLDWAITNNGSCFNESGTLKGPACVSNNSICFNASNSDGYLCNCRTGYTGNPYVHGGCTNIDECRSKELNSCPSASKCIDTEGSYKCQCNFGRIGEDCHRLISNGGIVAVLATFLGILLLALLLWFVHVDRKRRMKAAFFDKNGGKILMGAAGINIFTEKQLEKITNHYQTLIGQGAFGKVFQGTTDEKQLVAVKRSNNEGKDVGKRDNLQQGDDIVNEITFQFGNSHHNLVRLVGCCLETNIPVLVFEFISKGSLHKLLHEEPHEFVSLPRRLGIAIGSAEALAYIHSKSDRIHGDIKSANILLDDNLEPKVSDFGSSKILSVDMYVRAVAADMSYIDPVYMKTEHFVAKSDVYSFSVVLLELITRKTVKYGENKINSLPVNFVKTCKEMGNGREMYDRDILSHGDGAQCQHCVDCLDKIGTLAVRCLKEDVDERPTMAEVVKELKEAAKVLDKCELAHVM